ncbi:MAG: hypothetical protein RI947_462 [Candidatus Parcubacteria bacterium]|jgi:hypothetical protein
MKNMRNYVCGIFLSLAICSAFFAPSVVLAEGTISNIGVNPGSDAGADAVSWANAMPIMIDAYGNYIVPTENTGGTYYFTYSNNKGSSWTSVSQTGLGRPTAVYDSRNDKIHVLVEETNSVKYKRFTIQRNASYQITGISAESGISMEMEALGACATSEGGTYPMLLWKDNGSNGILAAFWEVKKICSGTTYFETRASMRTLSNTSADNTASNWKGLNGTDDNGTGAAVVDYNTLYTYTGTPSSGRKFTHAAFIRGGSGSKSEDIYYFNIDENATFGFRRLGWNGVSNNWSGAWTSRATFGGNVTNGSGYSAKDELITKPVYDSNLNRVYIGIARYLSGGLGDTQSLFYVDSSDSISSGVNVYSAGGSAWFAPTYDIMYNSDDQKIYSFYQTSSRDPTNSSNTSTSFEGDLWYSTYDGSTLGTAQPFMTQQIGGVTYTVDIPIVYQAPDSNRIILFFRADGPEEPFTPPHYIFFGYISSGGANTTPTMTPISGSNYSITTYNDFDQSCSTLTDAQVSKIADGEVGLAASFRDDFETPRSPYVSLFSERWSSGTWSGGSYIPQPQGTLLVYGANGAYVLGQTSFTNKILEYRAMFTNHDFQHLGWADGTGFGKFVMFSTANNGQLNTRTYDGSSQTMNGLGTSYYGAYHTYKVDFGASQVRYYIDNTLVDTVSTNIPTGAMYPIASNNTTTSGSNLTLDWLQVPAYPTTTGTYQTCGINSAVTDASWNSITFTASTSGSTSYTVKARTSNDNSSWSSWSSALSSGGNLTGAVGKFVQFLITLTGTSSETPTFNSVSMTVASPTPTSTSTPTPTLTPTPTSVSSSSSSSSQSTTSSSSSGNSGPSSDPIATTSHIFITAIGNLKTLFISSADSATVPKEPVKTDKRRPTIVGVAEAGTYVILQLKEQGDEHRMKVDDSSSFSWTSDHDLAVGIYTLAARVEDDGKVRRLPDFQVQITQPFATFKVSEVNTISEKPSKANPDTETHETSDATLTPTITGTRASATKDVTVEVKDTEGKPVTNSEVILYSQPKRARTDSKGQAHFKNIATGTHTLVVNYGASTGTQKITVSDDPSVKTVELKVVVEPKQSIPMNVFIITVIVLLGIILGLIYKNNLRRRHT